MAVRLPALECPPAGGEVTDGMTIDGSREWLDEETVVADVGGVNDEDDVWRACDEPDLVAVYLGDAARMRLSSDVEACRSMCDRKGDRDVDRGSVNSRGIRRTVCWEDGALERGVGRPQGVRWPDASDTALVGSSL